MPIPVIIDCDPGMDDMLALLLAAASAELDILTVTAVAGNRQVETTAFNARRIMDFAGCEHVPVYAGAARPITDNEPQVNDVHGKDGLGGADIPVQGRVKEGFAPDVLVDLLNGAAGISLVAIGPLTNLALAELRQPGTLKKAESILIMGGAAFCQGNATPVAEFNIYADAVAAHIVFNSGAKVVMFGLDVTRKALVTPAFEDELATLGNQTSGFIQQMFDFYAYGRFKLHDPCPVAYLMQPALFSGVEAYTGVDFNRGPNLGKTNVWQEVDENRPGPLNSLVVTEVDNQALLALLMARYRLLP